MLYNMVCEKHRRPKNVSAGARQPGLKADHETVCSLSVKPTLEASTLPSSTPH